MKYLHNTKPVIITHLEKTVIQDNGLLDIIEDVFTHNPPCYIHGEHICSKKSHDTYYAIL